MFGRREGTTAAAVRSRRVQCRAAFPIGRTRKSFAAPGAILSRPLSSAAAAAVRPAPLFGGARARVAVHAAAVAAPAASAAAAALPARVIVMTNIVRARCARDLRTRVGLYYSVARANVFSVLLVARRARRATENPKKYTIM